MKISPKTIALLLLAWLVASDAVVWLVQLWPVLPLQALLYISLSFLPGAALLRALRFVPESFLESLLYSFGLSILVLMISGLAANQILFTLGVWRPLELPGILGAWNIATIACIAWSAWANKKPLKIKRPAWPQLSKSTWALVVASSLLPVLAMFGAFRLNNGGDALAAMIALAWAAMVVTSVFVLRNRLHDNAIAWCIFMISLAILLMTSLRSWDISGHDIAREFRVYTLAHVYGHWDLSAYRDPYNACLSITILPEMYAKLLNISGLISFKFILQIIFAVCPVVIYLMLRKHASKLGALVGCGLFLSYPTFINDSAMLTRQGVAYLFFALALMVAMHAKKVNKTLFLSCAIGVVLSHYSTSYMFVAIFLIALASKWIFQLAGRERLKMLGDKYTVLSPAMLAVLGLITFLWYAQITATSSGLVFTLARSVENIPHLLSEDNKSSDTAAALLLATHKSQLDIYESYFSHPELNSNVVQAVQYRPEIAADEMPLTKQGEQLLALGIHPSITTDLRQYFAKILQLAVALGVCFAIYLYVRKKPKALPLDLICVSIAGVALLVFMVVLPNLSINYGVLRTFQQSLIFLVIPLVILLASAARFLWPKLRAGLATAGTVFLFLLFTGFFAQILGGVGATLSLNNFGLYYGLYYTTQADLRGYTWLKEHLPHHAKVRAASYAKAIMHDPKYPFDQIGIMPTQRPVYDYAYLGQAQMVTNKFYVNYEGSPLITTFPINFYQDFTNQIYSTGTTGVYR